jgi:putative ABC transport system permease protein
MEDLLIWNGDPANETQPLDPQRDEFLILESLEHAQERNAEILAEIIYNVTSDDTHDFMHLENAGDGVYRLKIALNDVEVTLDDTCCVNPDHTSTPRADMSNPTAPDGLVGGRVNQFRVRSTKSMTGHMVGGANGLDAAACLPFALDAARVDRLTTSIPQAVPGTAKRQVIALKRFRAAAVTTIETLRVTLDALRAHKLRSFLTLLGVILAVTTLVAVMSVVTGLNFYVSERVANLGANVFLIDRLGIITSEDQWVKAKKRPVLTLEEFEWLRDNVKTARRMAAAGYMNIDVRSGNILLENTKLAGATADYAELRNIGLASGRYLTEADDLHRSPICFIGVDVAKKFFANVDPIGKTIRAGMHTYEVVGVAEPIGSAFGISQDNYMLIPLGTYYKEWRTQWDSLTLFVQAQNTETIDASKDEVRMLLRASRHLPWSAQDNFAVLGSDSIMALWESLTGNLFGVAMGLTAVFLVVGGIVIMNIMLASVTERTREIGIRRSLGARKKHIILQFLTESALLAVVGGIIGIALAYGVVALGRDATSIPMRTPMSAVVSSLTVSTGVGLFFGIYPAMRAANLDPIEALRSEV